MFNPLKALMYAKKPGMSAAAIEKAAGLPKDLIYQYLNPSRKPLRSVPEPDRIYSIARAFDCDPSEVTRAFLALTGTPIDPPPLTEDEQAVLGAMRKLPDAGRRTIVSMAQWVLQEYQAGVGDSNRPGSRTEG